MRKEYSTLEEILKDADRGKISESHLMDEGLRTCFACRNTEDKYCLLYTSPSPRDS